MTSSAEDLLRPSHPLHRLLDAFEQLAAVRARWQAAASWYRETHAKGQGTEEHRAVALSRLEARTAEYHVAMVVFATSSGYSPKPKAFDPLAPFNPDKALRPGDPPPRCHACGRL